MLITVGRLALIFLLATMIDNGFSGYIAKQVKEEVGQITSPMKNCTLGIDISAREILIWPSGFEIKLQSNSVFVVKFWAKEKDKSFQFLCSDGENVSASLPPVNYYTSINNSCSESKELVQNDVEYWINDNSTVRIRFMDTSFTNCDFFYEINEGSEALTFSLQAQTKSEDLISLYCGESLRKFLNPESISPKSTVTSSTGTSSEPTTASNFVTEELSSVQPTTTNKTPNVPVQTTTERPATEKIVIITSGNVTTEPELIPEKDTTMKLTTTQSTMKPSITKTTTKPSDIKTTVETKSTMKPTTTQTTMKSTTAQTTMKSSTAQTTMKSTTTKTTMKSTTTKTTMKPATTQTATAEQNTVTTPNGTKSIHSNNLSTAKISTSPATSSSTSSYRFSPHQLQHT
nr:nuclear pore complex protein DDB_G0274915-like [Crassostrea gigas]